MCILYNIIQLERTKGYVPKEQFWKAVNVLEYKFLSIPIAFFLLRLWTCIINLIYVYILITEIPPVLVYLSVSVFLKNEIIIHV